MFSSLISASFKMILFLWSYRLNKGIPCSHKSVCVTLYILVSFKTDSIKEKPVFLASVYVSKNRWFSCGDGNTHTHTQKLPIYISESI